MPASNLRNRVVCVHLPRDSASQLLSPDAAAFPSTLAQRVVGEDPPFLCSSGVGRLYMIMIDYRPDDVRNPCHRFEYVCTSCMMPGHSQSWPPDLPRIIFFSCQVAGPTVIIAAGMAAEVRWIWVWER